MSKNRIAAKFSPEINRRRLLLGLAAASTAAAGGATSIATAAPLADENPELVRLANELPAFEAAYQAARRHQEGVIREWAPQWPKAPEDLTASPSEASVFERDFYGAHHGRNIRYSGYIEFHIDRARSALKSRATKKPWHAYWTREQWEQELADKSRLYDLAIRYEAECAWVTKAGQYEASWKATHARVQELGQHISDLMAQPETTMAGVIIKAQAMAAWGRVDKEDQRWGFLHPQWPAQIAAAILRHAEGGAA